MPRLLTLQADRGSLADSGFEGSDYWQPAEEGSKRGSGSAQALAVVSPRQRQRGTRSRSRNSEPEDAKEPDRKSSGSRSSTRENNFRGRVGGDPVFSSEASGNSKRRSRSGLRSSVSSRQGGASESSSDDEDFDEVSVPPHLRQAVPLHLREAVIKGGSAPQQNDAMVEVSLTTTSLRHKQMQWRRQRASFQLDETAGAQEKGKQAPATPPSSTAAPSPKVPVRVPACLLATQVTCFALWSLTAFALLAVYVVRVEGANEEMRRFNVANALSRLEAEAMIALTPAVAIVRTIALGAKAGIINATEPAAAVAAAATPHMAPAPTVQQVQVAGLGDTLVLLRPGTLHDEAAEPAARLPDVYSLPAVLCGARGPLNCFGLGDSIALGLRPAARDFAGVAWVGPSNLTKGPLRREAVPRLEDFVLVMHLVALVQLEGGAQLAIDVAMDLAALNSAIAGFGAEDQEEDGSAYVCTPAGLLLAGSNWEPVPVADPHTGLLKYTRLWDMLDSGLQEFPEHLLASHTLAERTAATGDWLVMSKPLSLGRTQPETIAGAAGGGLRVVVSMPLDEGFLSFLGFVALLVLLLPFLALLLLLLCCCTCRLASCCCRCLDRSLPSTGGRAGRKR